eukprot:GHVO01032984.1.p1 GENE.GHVO01032984.1~~GHVO01032984.1.p1  ORF type:complete len:111 (+),score=12.23 GHVO01032984.1:34-366(+)
MNRNTLIRLISALVSTPILLSILLYYLLYYTIWHVIVQMHVVYDSVYCIHCEGGVIHAMRRWWDTLRRPEAFCLADSFMLCDDSVNPCQITACMEVAGAPVGAVREAAFR